MDQSLIMKEYPHVRQLLQDFLEKHLLRSHYACFGDLGKKSCVNNYTDTNGNTYQLCIPEEMFCDGIPQCPDLSDEIFELCIDYFPTTATEICPAKDIFNNKTIKIKAVKCNGVFECKDQLDEENCKVSKKKSHLYNCIWISPAIYCCGFDHFISRAFQERQVFLELYRKASNT